MKTIILTRIKDDGVQTTGKIESTDGLFKRDTLERPDKHNAPNISCIPKGQYLCRYQMMWRHLTKHYCLQNVPGRSGIFIHAGNYWFDVLGCILLGRGYTDINHDGEIDLLNTRQTISEFENYLQFRDFILVVQ